MAGFLEKIKEAFSRNLSSDNERAGKTKYSLKSKPFDQEVYDLLIRIDKGHVATEDEKRMLSPVIVLRWKDVSKLPNSMGMLESLSILDLSFTQVSDITALSKLKTLLFLNLNSTQVSDISALSKLPSLSDLNLSNTQVRDLSALSKLPSLSDLNLSNTQVSDISELSNLKTLHRLDLSGLEIKNIGVLSELTSLEVLNLQDSITAAIPESILDLNLDFKIDKERYVSLVSDKAIFIHGLTLTDQPIEIFSQSRELLRAYYREGKQVAVNECKVIFLGDAESGKTHSIRRLLNNGEYLDDFDGESTPGIETTVSRIRFEDTEITVNYWDFGGQEIQHSMHRVFLTERTVYVVFLNARQDDLMDERARYWMENIKAFAPQAPVLVVINKTDQNEHPRFNEKGFLEAYGDQVKKVIWLSAKKDTPEDFLKKLQGNINSAITELPTVSKKIPHSWKNLMENIRGMENHYLTTDEFKEKCKLSSILDYDEIHDDLVDLFQVIGISFCYYKNRAIADYMLLNPKWMLNALYTIVVNGNAAARNGVITQNDLFDLLEKDSVNGVTIKRVIPDLRYKGYEINYILGVIRMFGLSYSMKGGSEFFPMLCDGDEKISVKDAVPEDALHFVFRYQYLPTNVVHRLIVEMQRDLDYRYVWYTGAIFRNELQNQSAYVHSIGNDLHIYVFGEDNLYSLNEYLTPILNTVRSINNDMGLSSKEFLAFRKNGVELILSFKEVMGNLCRKRFINYNEEIDDDIDYRDVAHRYADEHPKRDDKLLKLIIKALHSMQNNMTYYRNQENSKYLEDSRNMFVSSQLNMAGYTCCDQQTGGISLAGNSFGERDFVIKDKNGVDSFIYEGMNLAAVDKSYIDEHIQKLIDNYNPLGLRQSALVSYVECDKGRFKSFTNNYRTHIAGYVPKSCKRVGEPEDVYSSGQFLACMIMSYEIDGLFFEIDHIVVRVAP